MISIPDDPSVIAPILKELKDNFKNHTTKDLSYRKKQLKQLLKGKLMKARHERDARGLHCIHKTRFEHQPRSSRFISPLAHQKRSTHSM